MTSGKLFLSN